MFSEGTEGLALEFGIVLEPVPVPPIPPLMLLPEPEAPIPEEFPEMPEPLPLLPELPMLLPELPMLPPPELPAEPPIPPDPAEAPPAPPPPAPPPPPPACARTNPGDASAAVSTAAPRTVANRLMMMTSVRMKIDAPEDEDIELVRREAVYL